MAIDFPLGRLELSFPVMILAYAATIFHIYTHLAG